MLGNEVAGRLPVNSRYWNSSANSQLRIFYKLLIKGEELPQNKISFQKANDREVCFEKIYYAIAFSESLLQARVQRDFEYPVSSVPTVLRREKFSLLHKEGQESPKFFIWTKLKRKGTLARIKFAHQECCKRRKDCLPKGELSSCFAY